MGVARFGHATDTLVRQATQLEVLGSDMAIEDDRNVRRNPSTYLPAPTKSMGDMLLRERVVSVEQLKNAAAEASRTGKHLGAALNALGYVDSAHLVDFLSRQYSVPSIDLSTVEVNEEVLRLIPKEVSERHGLAPIALHGSTLVVAIADPGNFHAIDDLKFLTGLNIEVVVASEEEITKARTRFYTAIEKGGLEDAIAQQLEGLEDGIELAADGAEVVDVNSLEKSSEEAPVVRLVNLVLVDAIRRGASDIHIECYEKAFRVRYRIDGVLHEMMRPPMKLRNAMISRVKIMSSLDIAERRLPQDGRIKLKLPGGKECDFRVSVLPCLFGEKVVMRLLDKGNLQTDMTKLGFDDVELAKFKQDDDAVLGADGTEPGDGERVDGRGPGRVQPGRHQPVPDERRDRPELCVGAALVLAAGSGRADGRRDPRL